MSGTASVDEARTHLSRLLQRVESAGESIVTTGSGKPVARLVPVGGEPRRPGRLEGRIRIGKDLDAPLPGELLGAFRGEEP